MKKNYQLIRIKLEKNIKSEDLENLASGDLALSDQCKLHILNFFAYFQNVKALCVLFTIFLNKGCKLKIEKDPFNRDVLDIALEYKNLGLSKIHYRKPYKKSSTNWKMAKLKFRKTHCYLQNEDP